MIAISSLSFAHAIATERASLRALRADRRRLYPVRLLPWAAYGRAATAREIRRRVARLRALTRAASEAPQFARSA